MLDGWDTDELRVFLDHGRDAGLRPLRLHGRERLRLAGLAAAPGWHEVKVISQRPGHRAIGITVDR